MSHKPPPYTPNFPDSGGYTPLSENKNQESYPMSPQTGYSHPEAGPISPPGPPGPLPPGAHPLPGMQPGFQPGFQPNFQPGIVAGFPARYLPVLPPHSGYHQQPGYELPQPGYQQPQPGYPQPITNQPIMQQPGRQDPPGGWMSIPLGIVDCPPGLEYLSSIDQLMVQQKLELLEAFVGFETNNKYIIRTKAGQKVYYAIEDNDCCTRNCCGPMRPFDMKIMDNFQNEVIHLRRPLACDSCCCPCWLQSMEVSAPPGSVIGTIEQKWSLCLPSFDIKNAAGKVVLKIEGPIFTYSICGDVEFSILTKNHKIKIGKLSKHWTGLGREFFTTCDNFGIRFPIDLKVKTKALLLGACFLIDFMYFDKAGNKEPPGML